MAKRRAAKRRRSDFVALVAKRRGDGILFNEALAEEGTVVFAKACEMGLEGVVTKRAGIRAGQAATG
jgi:ATP-dependent DNA ligase